MSIYLHNVVLQIVISVNKIQNLKNRGSKNFFCQKWWSFISIFNRILKQFKIIIYTGSNRSVSIYGISIDLRLYIDHALVYSYLGVSLSVESSQEG